MKLTLPYPPGLNHLYATVRGRRVLSREGRRYKADVARLVTMGRLTGPVVVEVDVYRPRRAGDLDNVLKCLLDSLTGVAWEDDSQVVELRARRHDDKARPRVEVDAWVTMEIEHAPRPSVARGSSVGVATPAVYRKKP